MFTFLVQHPVHLETLGAKELPLVQPVSTYILEKLMRASMMLQVLAETGGATATAFEQIDKV